MAPVPFQRQSAWASGFRGASGNALESALLRSSVRVRLAYGAGLSPGIARILEAAMFPTGAAKRQVGCLCVRAVAIVRDVEREFIKNNFCFGR